MCKDDHTLSHCKEFIKMGTTERSEYVKTKHLCFNCLVPGHSAFKCKLPVSCRVCNRRHHSLLHKNKNMDAAGPTTISQPLTSTHLAEDKEEVHVNTMIASQFNTRQRLALLATAIVEVTNEHGQTIPLRALVDPGS